MKNKKILDLLSGINLTEIFKTKGDLKRWSAKRSLGGLIVLSAVSQINNEDISWQIVTLCAIGVLPLCLSFFENNNKCCKK